MRNKIKQMMNKEEGFTLVELLAVIVILGIIVAISIPAIGNIIDNARGNANEAEGALVIDAARLYEADGNSIGSEGITATELETAGYLEMRESDISGTVTKDSDGNYVFTPSSSGT